MIKVDNIKSTSIKFLTIEGGIMKSLNPIIWQNSLEASLGAIWTKFAEYTPNLFETLLLLLVGYFVSKAVAIFSKRILKTVEIDKASENQRFKFTKIFQMQLEQKILDLILNKILFLIILFFSLSSNSWYRGESWDYDNTRKWTTNEIVVFEEHEFPLTVYVWSDLHKLNSSWDTYAKTAVDIINTEYKKYRSLHGYLHRDMPDKDLLYYCYSWECMEKRKDAGKKNIFIKRGDLSADRLDNRKCSLGQKRKKAGSREYEYEYILWETIIIGLEYVRIKVYEKSGLLNQWEEYELNTLMHELLHAVGVLHLSKDNLMDPYITDCFNYSWGKHGISKSSTCYPTAQVFEKFRNIYTNDPHNWKNPGYQERMRQKKLQEREEARIRRETGIICAGSGGSRCFPL